MYDHDGIKSLQEKEAVSLGADEILFDFVTEVDYTILIIATSSKDLESTLTEACEDIYAEDHLQVQRKQGPHGDYLIIWKTEEEGQQCPQEKCQKHLNAGNTTKSKSNQQSTRKRGDIPNIKVEKVGERNKRQSDMHSVLSDSPTQNKKYSSFSRSERNTESVLTEGVDYSPIDKKYNVDPTLEKGHRGKESKFSLDSPDSSPPQHHRKVSTVSILLEDDAEFNFDTDSDDSEHSSAEEKDKVDHLHPNAFKKSHRNQLSGESFAITEDSALMISPISPIKSRREQFPKAEEVLFDQGRSPLEEEQLCYSGDEILDDYQTELKTPEKEERPSEKVKPKSLHNLKRRSNNSSRKRSVTSENDEKDSQMSFRRRQSRGNDSGVVSLSPPSPKPINNQEEVEHHKQHSSRSAEKIGTQPNQSSSPNNQENGDATVATSPTAHFASHPYVLHVGENDIWDKLAHDTLQAFMSQSRPVLLVPALSIPFQKTLQRFCQTVFLEENIAVDVTRLKQFGWKIVIWRKKQVGEDLPLNYVEE